MTRIYQIASAVIRKDDDILLVNQGDDNETPFWSLPGGVVENGELYTDAVIREVKEETGLIVKEISKLLWVVQCTNAIKNYSSTVCVFEVSEWEGGFEINDPDDLINNVSFLEREDALIEIKKCPHPEMKEPLESYLSNTHNFPSSWFYKYSESNISKLNIDMCFNITR